MNRYYSNDKRNMVYITIKVPIVLFIMAIAFFANGFFLQNKINNYVPYPQKTTGILYWERSSLKYKSDNGQIHNYYDVYADYTVNGKRYYQFLYTGKPSRFDSGIINYENTSNGKEVTIYYNPDNPSEISVPSENNSPQICFTMGTSLIFICIITLIILIIQKREKNSFYEDSSIHQVGQSFYKVSNIYGFIKKVLIVIFGILILLFGILVTNGDSTFSQNAIETTAIVSIIDSYEARDAIYNKRYIQTDVYVKYNVNGKIYEEKIDKKPSGVEKGDKIKIYYNSQNPSEIKSSKENTHVGYIIILVGTFFILSGIFLTSDKLRISHID